MGDYISRIIRKMKRERLLTRGETFRWIFIIGLFLGVAWWLKNLFANGAVSKQNEILMYLTHFIDDFTNVVGYSAKLDPYHNTAFSGLGEKAYPPLVYLVFYLFSGLVDIDQYYEANQFASMYKEPLLIFMYMIIHIGIFVLIFETIRNCLAAKRVQAVLIAFLILFSRPMLFSLERGNTIIFTMLMTAVFLFNFDSDNKVRREMAIICLALSAAFKITPAILGILLLTDKRNIKLALRAVLYGIIVFGVPFFFLNDNPIRSAQQLITNIQLNLAAYGRWSGVTLEACLTSIGLHMDGTTMTIVKYVLCAFLVFSAFFVQEKWKKVMMISLVLVTMPNHSGYYCILYMIPSFVLFLKEKEHKVVDWLILLPVLSTLIPHLNIFTANYLRTEICVLILIVMMVFYTILEIDKKRKNGMNRKPVAAI